VSRSMLVDSCLVGPACSITQALRHTAAATRTPALADMNRSFGGAYERLRPGVPCDLKPDSGKTRIESANVVRRDRANMTSVSLLVKGILAGVAIAAPVGPVNILCISRTLMKGRRAGLVFGLGAAAADTIYGAIAGFSISFVINLLIREEHSLRFYGV